MKSLFSFLLIMLFPLVLVAQEEASISGYITDIETGETLISANVSLKNTSKGTSTNTAGYFTLTNLTPGSYTVIATYIGFHRFEKNISLESGENMRFNIQLKPEGFEMEEVVVESSRKQKEQQRVGTAEISTTWIKNIPSVFQADVFRSLQLLPGVKAASDFSSGLYVRGGSPDQTLILLDRTTIYNPSHFFGFFSTFNPDAVKEVRLLKGGYPAKYGGRLGSVVTIYNKDGNKNEFEGSATLGMLASRLSIEGPFKNGSYMLAFRRSTLEPVLNILQQSYDDIPERFFFLDVNGKLNYDLNPDNKFSLSFYSGSDDLKFPFADDAVININYGNQTLSSTWTHIFSERVFSHFTLTGSRYFNYPSFDIANTGFKRSNDIYDYSFKTEFEYIPNNNHLISSGAGLGSLLIELDDRFDGEETFTSHIHSRYASWYLQDKWAISDRWIATPGIRIFAFSNGNHLKVEPRFSLEYRPTDRIHLQAAYGRYNQFLTLASNETFTGFDVWLTANEDVPPADGNQYVIGTKMIPWKGYGLDLEFYYRSMENLFEPDPVIPDQSGLPYPDTFRFGDGYAYGAELLFERQIGRLTGFLGYTFSVTRRRFPDVNKPIIVNSPARYYPPKHDRTHDLTAVLEYQFNTRWSTSLVFSYATGQAYTKPLGRTAAFDFPTTRNKLEQLIVGRVNASRLPSYHRLDISFSRKGTFFGLGEAEWQLQVINAYSRRNIWFYNYDLDKSPARREAVQLLPILPSITYTLSF